jgi:hypothetical protein
MGLAGQSPRQSPLSPSFSTFPRTCSHPRHAAVESRGRGTMFVAADVLHVSRGAIRHPPYLPRLYNHHRDPHALTLASLGILPNPAADNVKGKEWRSRRRGDRPRERRSSRRRSPPAGAAVHRRRELDLNLCFPCSKLAPPPHCFSVTNRHRPCSPR